MIPLFNPRLCKSGIGAVAWSLMERRLGPGSETEKFEQKIAELFNIRYVTALPSGTTALMMAVQILKKIHGMSLRSFYPAYGFIAGAEASILSGHPVTLIDVTSDTLQMCPIAYRGALEFGHPGWVTYIEHNGIPNDRQRNFLDVLSSRRMPTILDLACSIGNPYPRPPADFYTWSFSVPKLVTTGQGGAIGTNDKELHDQVRRIYDHGGNWRVTRRHSNLGLNFRFNDILASYGLAQLKQIKWIREKNREIWSYYNTLFHKPLPNECGWCYHVWSKFPTGLILRLRNVGIEAVQLYPLMSDHGIISGILSEKPRFANAESAASHVVYIPSWIGLKRSEVRFIAEQIQRAEEKL